MRFKSLILSHLDPKDVKKSPQINQTLMEVLEAVSGKVEYVDLVRKYQLQSETTNLLELLIAKSNEQIGVDAARLLLELKGSSALNQVLNGSDSNRINALLTALGGVGNTESISILEHIILLSNQTNCSVD
jgi:type IV secretory pathway VirB4 component